ncbi:Fe-S cluster assembly protein SufB [Candidatus Gracilibacteria bacterium]|nr:Fe-S cluster assembly protein SufB [Candidatus Gracilibacteria bacterium]
MSNPNNINISGTWDFHDNIDYDSKPIPGLSLDLIYEISKKNKEPSWMLDLRLKAYDIFLKKPFPSWGPNLEKLDLDTIYFFAKPKGSGANKTWDDVPENIKKTFDRLGIPEAEKEALAGVGAQYDSDAVYHSLKDELKQKGVIFDDLTHALREPEYEKIVKKYFSKCISIADHKFSALHYAVWSGGTFLYVPSGVKIDEPLQSYFRMNVKSGGQFEHTLIILEDDTKAHYIEGCSAPKYDKNSLHAGGVEIFVGKNSHMRYSSVENWSIDTFNLNTKRAFVQKNGFMEWVSGNMGSNTTMLYPCSMLIGENAKADHLGIAFANSGQNQDTGAKVIHIGKNTSSNIISKSLSKGGGISTYRGLVDIKKSALGSVSKIDCDGLILDEISSNNAIPTINIENSFSTVAHEATAGKINEKDLFYLTSRGIEEGEATSMIVNGFISPIMKELPLEYASEMNVLIAMEFEGGF